MLFIIGTRHYYQLGAGVRFGEGECTDADQVAFAEMLRDVVGSFGAEILAEEANQQALEEVGKTTSVLQLVATELAIPYVFCEPDRVERVDLGISSENQIRISAFPAKLEEVEIQRLLAESLRRREREWLRRLVEVKSKNVVFVCGSNHISTFVPLAEAYGFECKVVQEDWHA